MGNENKAKGAEAVFVLLVCSVENMPLTIWNGVQNAWQFRQWCSGSKPVSKIRKYTRDVKPQRAHRAYTWVLQQQEKWMGWQGWRERGHQGLRWAAGSPEGSLDATRGNFSQVGRTVGHSSLKGKKRTIQVPSEVLRTEKQANTTTLNLNSKERRHPGAWKSYLWSLEWMACLRACRKAQRNNL